MLQATWVGDEVREGSRLTFRSSGCFSTDRLEGRRSSCFPAQKSQGDGPTPGRTLGSALSQPEAETILEPRFLDSSQEERTPILGLCG